MDRNSFTFYSSFLAQIELMPNDSQLTIFKAIATYALKREQPTIKEPMAKLAWAGICAILDAQWKKYEAGKLGGCPKGITNNPAGRPKQSENKALSKRKQSENKALSKQDKDKDKDKGKDKEGKGENAAPAPASQEEKEFAEKMRETYPTLCTLERPLTCDEMKKLKDAYGAERVKSILQEMEKCKAIIKKRSVYLTAKIWIRKDEK